MTEFSFSDKDLQLAAGKVRTALLESLPAPSDCTCEFSDSFLEKMELLFRQGKPRHPRKKLLLRIAAVFLALLIGTAVFAAFHAPIRAAIKRWVQQMIGNEIIYSFSGENITDPLPRCQIGWLPAEYELMQEHYDETESYSAFYQDAKKNAVFIHYSYMKSGAMHTISFDESTTAIRKQLTVNGMPGELFLCANQSESSTLVWIDEERNIEFYVDGLLSEQDLIRIAKSITLLEP